MIVSSEDENKARLMMESSVMQENCKVTITFYGNAMSWPNAESLFSTMKQAFLGAGFLSSTFIDQCIGEVENSAQSFLEQE